VPGFSSRGGQKQDGGTKNQKGGHIFQIQYWIMQQPGGQTQNGGAPISNGGAAH